MTGQHDGGISAEPGNTRPLCSMHLSGHPWCLNITDKKLIARMRTYAWECMDCKACQVCGSQDDGIIYCDRCDRAEHAQCLNPPMDPSQIPEGERRLVYLSLSLEKGVERRDG